MKNMKKFITLCGFLILGSIACGDVDIVKAEAINNQATDTSGYTITIPSDVDIDKESGKGSFAVTGKMDAQTKLDVTVNSQNGYKLKCGSKSIDYTLAKQSFRVDNIKSSNMKCFNENFDATLSYTDMNFSGSYRDKLTFNIESNVYIYKLDLNSILDGVNNYSVHDYGTADIYINGKKVADDVSDWMGTVHYGDSYEINDIKGTTGHHYSGASDGENNLNNFPLKGKIGIDTKHVENSKGILYSSIFLKFDTNKLTVNYHADGAQTWHHFDNITYDVSGKDIAASETRLFGSHYDGKSGLGDVSRLTKNGYTAKPNTWIVGKNGTKEVSDNVGLAKSQDVAEYCGVLDEFKKNDTVIDLYPIWTPIQSQLNLNANGGTFSDNSTFKTATDKLVYDSSSNANISAYTPTRKGYDFDGWYTDETGGTKVYNADGSAVNGTQYWQNNVYQNIEGTNILRGDDGQDMAKHRLYALDPVGNNIVDDGWINESSLGYGKCKKITINHVHEGSDKTTGTYRKVLDEYCERTSQPANILINKKVLLSFKIKSDSPMLFEKWGLESTSAYIPYTLKTTSEWKTISIETTITESTLSHIHALIFYTLSTTGTYYVGDVSITLDTDIELFAHWTKKKYSTGTVLNIEGSDYIVMSQTDDDKYLVIRKDSIGDRAFQSSTRIDGQNRNTYEDSEIDNYLENDWYNSLSTSMKVAIDPTDIKQSTYANFNDFNSKQETGYNGQIYNIIKRHVFLPSVNEIENVVDLNKSFSICGFVGHNKNIWTRDSIQNSNEKIEAFYGNYRVSGATTYKSNAKAGVRPTFVIDLSKVDYTVTGHVSYK